MQSRLLQSRSALIDRIALQLEYGQHFINIVGQSGLGKSYLLESFITDKYPEFNKAFIQVTASQTDQDLMHRLLEHSFRAPLVDHTLSLSENFQLIHQQQPSGPCLWVLDGGRHLSEEFIEQIRRVIQHSGELVYVLVGSQQAGIIPGALDIHLEPLPRHECKQLMQWYFKNLPLDEDPVFNAFIESTKGNPALLLSWQPKEQSLDLQVKPKTNWLWHFIGLALVLTLLAIGLLYKTELEALLPKQDNSPLPALVLPSPVPVQDKQTDSTTADDIATSTLINEQATLNAPVSTSPETEATADPLKTVVRNDIGGILAELEAVPDKPVAWPVSADTSNVTALVTEALELQNMQSDTAVQTTANKVTQLDEPLGETPQAELATSGQVHALDDSAWFLALAASDWTIQVMAVKDVKDAQSFLASYPELAAKVYPALRNGAWWYVVTVGEHRALSEAKEARNKLPEAVLKNQPFYKKLSQIQEEIRASTR
jgi:DamX protein